MQFNSFSLDSAQTGPTPAGSAHGRNTWVICKLTDDELKLICRIIDIRTVTSGGFEPWTLAVLLPCCCRWPRLSLSETLRWVPCGRRARGGSRVGGGPLGTLLPRGCSSARQEELSFCFVSVFKTTLLRDDLMTSHLLRRSYYKATVVSWHWILTNIQQLIDLTSEISTEQRRNVCFWFEFSPLNSVIWFSRQNWSIGRRSVPESTTNGNS